MFATAHSIQTLSDRLDECFNNPILVTCVRCIPLPFEITVKLLGSNTLNFGDVPALHELRYFELILYVHRLRDIAHKKSRS